jgi:hypothetical protein
VEVEMRALVVYESMYGNTHTVADHIAEGLRTECEVDTVTVAAATRELVAAADLMVVGGPTHVHSMSRATSRRAAVDAAEKDAELELDPEAPGPGLREWLAELGDMDGHTAAAFDTRIDAAAALTGRASKAIGRQLRHHGFRLMIEPESFLVDKQNHLLDGEADRARAWGRGLAVALPKRLQTS